jgi:hypothetical protein
MMIKLLAILLILIGTAGLILPVIPGILLITLGVLLLYRDRHEEISRLVNEKAPVHLADFYNNFMHRIVLPAHYIGVDWDWVKNEAIRTEKIDVSLKDGQPGNIRDALDASIRKARSLASPKYVYGEVRLGGIGDDFIELESGDRFLTKKIPAFIKGSDSLVIFVVTIGDSLEKEASLLTSGKDPLAGYLLDRIGSFAVESLAENLEKRLRKDYAGKKRSLSSRFSPGYCDWPVEEQFKLSRALDFSKAGVRLTEGCMMAPKKSISAIAAVADEGVFKDFISSCNICERGDCGFRRSV